MVSSCSHVRIVAIVCLFVHWIDYFCIIIRKLSPIDSFQLCGLLGNNSETSVKPGFHYTANATTTTQKQSDYMLEQSFFTLIACFDSKLVVVVVVIGLMETRLNGRRVFRT